MENFERVLRNLGRNIYRARNSKRLSQDDLARLSQLPRSTLSAIENGRRNPSLQSLALISQALSISINELMATRMHQTWQVNKSDLEHEIQDHGRVRIFGLIPKHINTVRIRRIELDESAKMSNSAAQAQSQQYLTILAGVIFLHTNHGSDFLRAGKSVFFRCDQDHTYENAGDESAILIAVNLPFAPI